MLVVPVGRAVVLAGTGMGVPLACWVMMPLVTTPAIEKRPAMTAAATAATICSERDMLVNQSRSDDFGFRPCFIARPRSKRVRPKVPFTSQ
jgi:hypothetical protein